MIPQKPLRPLTTVPAATQPLIALFRTLIVEDTATDAQAKVVEALESDGYDVWKEVTVGTPGTWSHGRIDLFASRNGEAVAIEIDHRRPRKRSIVKLRTVRDASRMVLVRRLQKNKALDTPGGIHAVIGLHCPAALH